MLYIIFLYLSMTSMMSVNGFQPDDLFKPLTSSEESVIREETPIPFVYTSLYKYGTSPQPQTLDQEYAKFNDPVTHHPPVIQYAPLNPNVQDYFLENAETKKNKDHLEPRVENLKNMDFHSNYFRSFVPGHNVEMLPSRRQSSLLNALFETSHGYLQPQKITRCSGQDQPKRSKFVTRVFDNEAFPTPGPTKNTNQMQKIFPGHSFTSHVKPHEDFLQAPHPKVPRLHLNIARVYGFAHLPHKASAAEPQNIMKNEIRSVAHTGPIIKSQKTKSIHDKTLLYPVDDLKKFFPIP